LLCFPVKGVIFVLFQGGSGRFDLTVGPKQTMGKVVSTAGKKLNSTMLSTHQQNNMSCYKHLLLRWSQSFAEFVFYTVHSPLVCHIFIQSLNALIDSQENWTPTQNGRLDGVGGGDCLLAHFAHLPTPNPACFVLAIT